MGKNNVELLKLAKKHLGQGGAIFRKYCGMSGGAWCCAFVTYEFHEGDDSHLFYGGKKVVYCPTAIQWCRANLAQIPIYLALPMDIIFFDWNANNVPDHIGFVRERKTDQEVYTIEGNTSGGIVAEKTRTVKYVLGCFRPHFTPTSFSANKPLAVDGQFNYSSIAVMQRWLGVKVDAILGKDTVKALQKKLGVSQDGSWGVGTSKALQKLIGTTVDGAFGEKSVKAFQTYLNKVVFDGATPKPTPTPTPKPTTDKLDIDGSIGRKTVLRMQEFFGTLKDGIVSGQKESLYKYYGSFDESVVRFDGGGSALVMKLQKWVGVKEDGILGEATVKAWQKKIGASVDGSFGTNSAKIWQRYLNENDKAVYPTVKPSKPTPTPSKPTTSTNALKIVAMAKSLCWAYGTAEKKWKYSTGSPTDAYKKKTPKVNKITRSDCGYFVKVVTRNTPTGAFNPLNDKMPSTFKLVHSGKAIPSGLLQAGDIIAYKKTEGQHTLIYMGDGLIAEAGRKVRFPVIRKSTKYNGSDVKKNTIKVYRAK